MTMKKYTKGEGSLEVFRGEEAQVINDHFAKTGKAALSEFNKEELEDFNSDLEKLREKSSESKEESLTSE